MPVEIQCRGCQRRYAADDSLAGTQTRCPGCGSLVQVPALASPASGQAGKITVQCTSCQQRYLAPANLAGKPTRCPGCGATVHVPAAPAAAAPTVPAQGPLPQPKGAGGSITVRCQRCRQRYAAPAALAGKQINCPGCGSSIAVGAIRTVARPAAAASSAVAAPPAPVRPAAGAAQATIAVQCDGCHRQFSAPTQLAGRNTTCPSCGNVFLALARSSPAASPDVAADPLAGLSGSADLLDDYTLAAAESGPALEDPLGPPSSTLSSGTLLTTTTKKKKKRKKSAGGFSGLHVNINRLNVALVIGGGLLLFLGMQQLILSSSAKSTPQQMTAAQLASQGPGNNTFIELRDFAFLFDEAVVSYTERFGHETWTMVYVPLVPSSGGPRSAPAAPRGQAMSQVKIILRSSSIKDPQQLAALAQRPTISGMVVNRVHSIGKEESELLNQGLPGVNLRSCHLFHADRKPDSGLKMLGFLLGGVALLGVGVFLVFWTD